LHRLSKHDTARDPRAALSHGRSAIRHDHGTPDPPPQRQESLRRRQESFFAPAGRSGSDEESGGAYDLFDDGCLRAGGPAAASRRSNGRAADRASGWLRFVFDRHLGNDSPANHKTIVINGPFSQTSRPAASSNAGRESGSDSLAGDAAEHRAGRIGG